MPSPAVNFIESCLRRLRPAGAEAAVAGRAAAAINITCDITSAATRRAPRRRCGHRPARSLLLALAAAGLAAAQPAAPPAGAETVIGGPFELVAPDGTHVTDAQLRGKWLLVFFGYTFCPSVCPTTLGQIAVALAELGDASADVQPVFITVDPQRDTPAKMGDYAAAFDPRILALSGSSEAIAAVMEAYGAYAMRRGAGADYLVDHSTYIYAMGPDGRFVRGFDSEATGAEIAQTLRGWMRGD